MYGGTGCELLLPGTGLETGTQEVMGASTEGVGVMTQGGRKHTGEAGHLQAKEPLRLLDAWREAWTRFSSQLSEGASPADTPTSDS